MRRSNTRLRFWLNHRFKRGRFSGRAYISKNTGTLYWIRPVPNKAKSPAHFLWHDWVLYCKSKKLGLFDTLEDARLAAMTHFSRGVY